jgi:hypothetical protein
MAARTRRLTWDERTRNRIRVGWLLDRLHKHVEGTVELTVTQIRAAEVLLKKALPDLVAAQIVDQTVTLKYAEVPQVMPQDLWLQRRGQPLLPGEVAPTNLCPDAPVTPHPGPCFDLKAGPGPDDKVN